MVERNEEIIKIATDLFSEKGYDNTTTRELAKAAELSSAGLYYFFQNKEEILFTILNLALSRFLESVSSAINSDDDPQTNITRIIDYLAKHYVENKKEVDLILKEIQRLNPEQLSIIRNIEREAFDLIRNEIRKLNEECSLNDFNLSFLTFALLGIINYTRLWFDTNNQLSIDEFAKQTTELFFNGVLTKHQ